MVVLLIFIGVVIATIVGALIAKKFGVMKQDEKILREDNEKNKKVNYKINK